MEKTNSKINLEIGKDTFLAVETKDSDVDVVSLSLPHLKSNEEKVIGIIALLNVLITNIAKRINMDAMVLLGLIETTIDNPEMLNPKGDKNE